MHSYPIVSNSDSIGHQYYDFTKFACISLYAVLRLCDRWQMQEEDRMNVIFITNPNSCNND